MLGLRCLVLHPDYTPLSIFPFDTIPVEEAIVRVLKDNANCILHYNRKVLTPSTDKLYWPSVIVNREFYKRYDDIRLKHETLFYRDHGICQYCEKPLKINGDLRDKITCDHVVPVSRGGVNDWHNVVAACRSCNIQKDSKLPGGRWVPKIKPYKPSVYDLLDNRRKFPIVVDDMGWIDFLGGKTGWSGEVFLREATKPIYNEFGLSMA